MEAAKKNRRIQRTLFTKCLKNFTDKCANINTSQSDRQVALQLLELRMAELESVSAKYIETLMEKEDEEKIIETEIEAHEGYKLQFLTAKLGYLGEVNQNNALAIENDSQSRATARVNTEKPFKRPTLNPPTFNGHVNNWLPFWSHYKKIHEDANIPKEDKLEYLKRQMEKGSKADNIIQGYPTTAANYDKAFESLKNRYGRDDLLIEFYTRELLSLAIKNAANKGKQKASLSSIYDKVSAHIRALETLGVKTDNCAVMLYPLVESSLPEEILRTWQRTSHSNAAVGNEVNGAGMQVQDRLTRLLQFLEIEADNEESFNMAVSGFSIEEKEIKRKEMKGKTVLTEEQATANVLLSSETKRSKCIFCGDNHENALCEKAKKLSMDTRKKIIKENNCCYKCLKRGHMSRKCRVKSECAWCGGRHVIVVCPSLENSSNDNSSKVESSHRNETSEQCLANFSSLPYVRLKTLRVVMYSDNKEKEVRAVIDDGSQRSYVRTEIAKFLGYEPLGNTEITHTLFGGVRSEQQSHNIYLARVKALNGQYACNFNVMNQNVICADIPKIDKSEWFNALPDKNIILSDVNTDVDSCSENIDLLIGADIAGKLFTGKKVNLSNDLTALEYKLGWTVMGKTPVKEKTDAVMTTIALYVNDSNITDLWSLDTLGIKDPVENSNRFAKEKSFKENFLSTVHFKENKRYSVSLPWIDNHAPISSNFEIAKKRLEKITKILKTECIYDDYDKVLKEWLDQDIIERVPDKEINNVSHYLPHRPVLKVESTTKIRPVFDASACEKGYPSLNQILEKGPNLIELIPNILIRFRKDENRCKIIGVVADIKKAFLQIEVNPDDRNFLRFLWFEGEKHTIYRHKRLVFGLTCSPFILGAVLEYHLSNMLNVTKDSEKCWTADTVKKLIGSFYVDNCITSVSTMKELQTFKVEAENVMLAGGFDLRGWEFTNDCTEKENTLVLGIMFNKKSDTLSINPALLKDAFKAGVTKRTILSAAHRIYDPIGFTAPVMIYPKLILKRLWKDNIKWDTLVEESIRKDVLKWYEQLHYLIEIKIPRKLGAGDKSIHTFCDASQQAYAAVTFIRIERDGETHIRLLAAKARIAPENTSIPRLELLAASIGARQTHELANNFKDENISIYLWSDSTTVLAWLQRDKQWGIFVWNRVREIRKLTATAIWRYVPSEKNPADLPSRGCHAKHLIDSRWWEGPDWLYEESHNWPSDIDTFDENEIDREIKKSVNICTLNVNVDEQVFWNIVDKFSSYSKMIRFFVIMRRFKNFLLKKDYCKEKYLTLSEIKEVELKFLQTLQKTMFTSEKDKKLKDLQCFVHKDNLIRLKTKIIERKDKFEFVCPILLDSKSKIVELIIREFHENACHAGVQTVMCELRERFWILSVRKAVHSVINKCTVCKRYSAKPVKIEPAPLPENRIKDAAVFGVTGVDYAGPVFLKGGQKAWICLFTCAIYRAIHVELVTSLSTLEFLGALRRFIGRRGRPLHIYSDNGTNFVGADNALKNLNWHVISSYSTSKQIEWHFNPPSAAWWGGWWERLIGMLIYILRKVLGKACLTYEELYTVLCDCEYTVNSRPLTYLSKDPQNLKALSLAMFLYDNDISDNPDLDIINMTELQGNYQRRQEIMDHLRHRFRKEYLSQLIFKNKNKKEFHKLETGDLVMIGDDNVKRLNWPLAKIEKLILGRDNIPRVALLKTKDGVLTRPLQKLYPLEISSNQSDVKNADDLQSLRKKVGEKINVKDPPNQNVKINEKEKTKQTRSGRIVKQPKKLM